MVLTPNTFLQVKNPIVFILNLCMHGSYPCASVFAGWKASEENIAYVFLHLTALQKHAICVNRLIKVGIFIGRYLLEE